MLNRFKEHIQDQFPELLLDPFLIACSGGIDSMVLVEFCIKSDLKFGIAHCNFNLRGDESDRDQEFVRSYAQKHQIEFHTISFDTKSYQESHGLSIQLAARELRYNWFKELIDTSENQWVLTAHQADDSVESFLINLSRGTGIDGLVGIPSKRDVFRRPLQIFTRKEIETYAIANHIKWREDSSNEETKYIRNQVRHKLMPEFNQLHPTATANLIETQKNLASDKALIESFLEPIKSKLFVVDNEVVSIIIKDLMALKPLEAIIYKLFSPFGFKDAIQVIELTKALSGKKLLSKTHILLKDRDCLLLKATEKEQAKVYVIEKDDKEINEPISMIFSQTNTLGEARLNEIFVDKDKLKFPLSIRKPQLGDRLSPYGLSGSKKISKLFKDEKFSQFEKESQWLLCDSSGTIVWVIGQRADRRFKVSDKTKSILKISLKNKLDF